MPQIATETEGFVRGISDFPLQSGLFIGEVREAASGRQEPVMNDCCPVSDWVTGKPTLTTGRNRCIAVSSQNELITRKAA